MRISIDDQIEFDEGSYIEIDSGNLKLVSAGTDLYFDDASGSPVSLRSLITSAYTNEMAQDACASMQVAGNGITISYNDASNQITYALDPSAMVTFAKGTIDYLVLDGQTVSTSGVYDLLLQGGATATSNVSVLNYFKVIRTSDTPDLDMLFVDATTGTSTFKTNSSTYPLMKLISTSTDATGPKIVSFFDNLSTLADGDEVFRFNMDGKNFDTGQSTYGSIVCTIDDSFAGDGILDITSGIINLNGLINIQTMENVTIHNSVSETHLSITCTDAGATGVQIETWHQSTTPAANDLISQWIMYGRDSAQNKTEYASIKTYSTTVTNGSEVGSINLAAEGTTGTIVLIPGASGSVNISQGSLNITGLTASRLLSTDGSKNLSSVGVDSDIDFSIGRARIGGLSGDSDVLYLSHYDTFSSGSYALKQTAAGATFLNSASGQSTVLRNNNANVLIANSTGVGIGLSPACELDIKSGAANSNVFTIERSSDSGNIVELFENSAGSGLVRIYSSAGAETIRLHGGASAVSYFSGSGNVGFGTTGPDRQVDILDASNPQLRLTYTDASVYTDFQTNSSGNLVITPTGGTLTMTRSANSGQKYIEIENSNTGSSAYSFIRMKSDTDGSTNNGLICRINNNATFYGGGGALTLLQVSSLPIAFVTNNTLRGLFSGSGDLLVQAGSSSGNPACAVGGTLNVNTTTVGNVGGGEDNLMTYSIPANTLSTNGDSISFVMAGSFTATITNKTIKIYFGSTVLFDSSSFHGLFNVSGDWMATGTIIRTGASTQRATTRFSTSGGYIYSNDYTTPGETLSGAITIKATGEGDSGSNDNITQTMLKVDWGSIGS